MYLPTSFSIYNTWVRSIHWINLEKMRMHILVRLILGLLVTSGLTHIYKSLKGYCDLSCRRWWLVVMVTQFHFLFYSTRTLPNIFALVIGLFLVQLIFTIGKDMIEL